MSNGKLTAHDNVINSLEKDWISVEMTTLDIFRNVFNDFSPFKSTQTNSCAFDKNLIRKYSNVSIFEEMKKLCNINDVTLDRDCGCLVILNGIKCRVNVFHKFLCYESEYIAIEEYQRTFCEIGQKLVGCAIKMRRFWVIIGCTISGIILVLVIFLIVRKVWSMKLDHKCSIIKFNCCARRIKPTVEKKSKQKKPKRPVPRATPSNYYEEELCTQDSKTLSNAKELAPMDDDYFEDYFEQSVDSFDDRSQDDLDSSRRVEIDLEPLNTNGLFTKTGHINWDLAKKK